jgi:hypothetical protein
MVNAVECACGCGRPAKKKWHDYLCRTRYRNALRTPEKRREEDAMAKERKLLERHTTHQVMATVHRMTKDDENEIVQQVVRVPTPKLGIWGI